MHNLVQPQPDFECREGEMGMTPHRSRRSYLKVMAKSICFKGVTQGLSTTLQGRFQAQDRWLTHNEFHAFLFFLVNVIIYLFCPFYFFVCVFAFLFGWKKEQEFGQIRKCGRSGRT